MNTKIVARQIVDKEDKIVKFSIYGVCKKVFDVTFSIVAILIAMPVMFMIAVLIKVKSPEGSILFKQKRLGLKGKEFYVYKFRTMVPDAEKVLQDYMQKDEQIKKEYLTYRKLKSDPRIIPVIGEFLRKSSLDELPQFFNVIKGDMSIVGPRPYLKDELKGYSQKVITDLFSIKPGITGYWQIIPNRHDSEFESRIDKDLEYIDRKNFILDLSIVFKTIFFMLMRKGM